MTAAVLETDYEHSCRVKFPNAAAWSNHQLGVFWCCERCCNAADLRPATSL